MQAVYFTTKADKVWLHLKDKGFTVTRTEYRPSMRVEISVKLNDKVVLYVDVLPTGEIVTRSPKYLRDEYIKERDRARRIVQEIKKKGV